MASTVLPERSRHSSVTTPLKELSGDFRSLLQARAISQSPGVTAKEAVVTEQGFSASSAGCSSTSDCLPLKAFCLVDGNLALARPAGGQLR